MGLHGLLQGKSYLTSAPHLTRGGVRKGPASVPVRMGNGVRKCGRGVKLTTYLHLMPSLRIIEVAPPRTLHLFTSGDRTILPLRLSIVTTFTMITFVSIVTLVINVCSRCVYTKVPQVLIAWTCTFSFEWSFVLYGWSKVVRRSARAIRVNQARSRLRFSDWRG